MTAGEHIQSWPIDSRLAQSEANIQTAEMVKKLGSGDPDAIISGYVYYKNKFQVLEEIRNALSLLPRPLRGTGIEVGAGVAIFSAAACLVSPEIQKIYAIELSRPVVENLQGDVVRHMLGEQSGRVVPVVGSFDDIQLPDASCDFCLDIDSLHHSDDLPTSLREIGRILRTGGMLVMLDRMHPEHLSERQRERMLNLQYSQEWLKQNGFTVDRMSRRDNGEHEYRLSEWKAAWTAARLELLCRYELREVNLARWLFKLATLPPYWLRELLSIHVTRVSPDWREVFWMLKEMLKIGTADPLYRTAVRDYTLIALEKKE